MKNRNLSITAVFFLVLGIGMICFLPFDSFAEFAGSAQSNLPDLTVTDIWISGCLTYYKIKNIGGYTSPSSTSILEIDSLSVGGDAVPPIEPGMELTRKFYIKELPQPGMHDFKIVADAFWQIKELDENNNVRIERLWISGTT
jgi:subtilase family serine protease